MRSVLHLRRCLSAVERRLVRGFEEGQGLACRFFANKMLEGTSAVRLRVSLTFFISASCCVVFCNGSKALHRLSNWEVMCCCHFSIVEPRFTCVGLLQRLEGVGSIVTFPPPPVKHASHYVSETTRIPFFCLFLCFRGNQDDGRVRCGVENLNSAQGG